MERKEVYSNDYMSLFDDWEMWLSDWVWYVWELDKQDVYNLYLALHKFFNKE
mgnify:CR=1 FL=1